MRFIYTKAFVAFVACLVIIALGLFLQVKGLLQPMQYALLQAPQPVVKTFRVVTAPVKGFLGTLFSIRKIVEENNRLNSRVGQLQQRLIDIDHLKAENEALKKEIGFAESSKLNLQPCTVLTADPQGVADTLVINCGTAQGISQDQAVMTQEHLVGKVIYAGQYTSTVLLITNAQSTIDARLSKNGTEGLIKGSYGSGVILDLVSQNAELNKGELIVTAGINSRVPKNLLIGEVGDVISKPNELFKKASVITPIKFHDISYVFVVKQ
jgi:rod shape-determining protein MreC